MEPGQGWQKLLGLVLFLALVATLPPQQVYWDGLGFLLWAEEGKLDYGHLLYLPLLSLAETVFPAWLTESRIYGAKLLSALAAGLVFLLVWTRLERRGLAPSLAVGITVLLTTTPLVWGQAGRIEPSLLTLAGLLVSARAAERYGERRSLGRASALAVAFVVTLGFHVVSLLALPWLVRLASGPAPRPPARHLLVPAIALGAGLAVAVASGRSQELLGFFPYWMGFLPDASLDAVVFHLGKGGRLVRDGLPWLAVLGGAALLVGVARRQSLRALYLAVPYAAAFVLFGKPVIALALPVALALALLAAELFAGPRPPAGAVRRATLLALPALLALQLWTGAMRALREVQTPDDRRVQAELLAGALPRGTIMIAGDEAHHVRWYTGAPVVALPNEIHRAASDAAVGGGALDPIALVNDLAEKEARRYSIVYLTSEALLFLEWRFGADPAGLRLAESGVIHVREDPELYLVPFAFDGRPKSLQFRE